MRPSGGGLDRVASLRLLTCRGNSWGVVKGFVVGVAEEFQVLGVMGSALGDGEDVVEF